MYLKKRKERTRGGRGGGRGGAHTWQMSQNKEY